MVRYGFTTILLFICVTHTVCQFIDFFAAFQPIIKNQPRQNFQYDVTTKRPRKTTTKSSRRNPVSYNIEIENKFTLLPLFTTTQRSPINNTKRTQKQRKDKENANRNDQIYFNDERNTINYKYTTQSPYPSRSGVKPAVVNGPAITNKPPTSAPFDVSPELILGPDEDYMSNTEKRRYLEAAEKMCDRYKSMDVKQIQAIPLLPSPRPVRVNVSSCVPSNVPLVVGGKIVSIKEFPHMALLGWPKTHTSGYSWKCGGSVLSERYILTAAHCAYQDKDNNVATGPPRAAQLGSSYLNDPGALVIKVAAVVRHPKYKLPKSYYDIALIKLAKTLTFSEVIKPACLGTPPSPGEHIIATGWGKTEFGGDQSLELRSVSLPVWEIPQCKEVLGTSRKIPEGPSRDTQICAGEMEGGKDTCQGDSGGPAQIQDGCVWRVVAVTSLGRSCGAPNTPALYAIAHPVFISAVVFGDQVNKGTNNQNRNDNNNNAIQFPNTRRTDQNYGYENYNITSSTGRSINWNNGVTANNQRNNVDNQRKQFEITSQSPKNYNRSPGYGDGSVSRDTNSGTNANTNIKYDGSNYNRQNTGYSQSSNNPNSRRDSSGTDLVVNTNRNNFNNQYYESNQQPKNNNDRPIVSNTFGNNSGRQTQQNSPNKNVGNNVYQNPSNVRYETTTKRYVSYNANQNYDSNNRNQNNNYYQTDGNIYNQERQKTYAEEAPEEYHHNSNQDNVDSNNYYSRLNYDQNDSPPLYQSNRNIPYSNNDYNPYENTRRQSEGNWWS